MDHLPLPKSAPGHLRVPYISTILYDNGFFSSFPDRHGWQFTFFQPTLEETVSHNGETPLIEDFHIFLQTWLYFGTLHEVFRETVKLEDFIFTDENGNRFLYTGNLRQTMTGWLDQTVGVLESQNAQHEKMVSLCNHIRSHLDLLYYLLSGLRALADPGGVAATALLGESLENFYRTTYREVLKLETPPNILWGMAFSKWLTEKMKVSGWCPSTITRLAEDSPRISLLYYYSLLPAPQLGRDHSLCTSDSCLALKIDPSNYHTAHTRPGCGCPDLSMDVEIIGDCLRKGRLPLVEVPHDEDPMRINITCREDGGDTGFVAISHVWADGLGNINDNSLPACSLQEISRLVSKLPRIPRTSSPENGLTALWIDTVCVPVLPAALKQLALNYLRHPYMHAEHVLILDNYLRNVDAEDCDILEIFARVSCGNWVGRLWTLQEGRLAKRTWFQFRDKAIELKALWEATERPRSRGPDYWDMLVEAVVKWDATDLWGTRRAALGLDLHSAKSLRRALCFRSVSVPSDEALCLFCLAGLNMEQITSVPPAAHLRMKVFWSSMHRVPSGLIYSKSPQKLEAPGLRWAPLSFMGSLPRHHWAGIVKCADDMDGIPTQQGLQVKFPGFTCTMSWDGSEDIYGFHFHCAGIWFRLYFEEPWHTQSAFLPPQGPQTLAIVLMEPLQRQSTQEDAPETQKPKWNEFSDGLLGYVTHETDGIKHIKGLCHITVYLGLKKPLERVIFDASLDCIATEASNIDQMDDVHLQTTRMTKAYFAKHPTIRSACDTWAQGSSYASGEERFAALLVEVKTPTKKVALNAEKVPDDQGWCVD